MANTHVVLEGVKDYTLELLGTKARDEAVDAADRAEAQAERAEAAADNAEVGIRDDTVTRPKLAPEVREELDGKAPAGHRHPVTDLTATGSPGASTYLRGDGSWSTPPNTTYSVPSQTEAEAGTAATARAFSAQRVRQAVAAYAPSKGALEAGLEGKADRSEIPTTAADVGAATPAYVDERIQLVTTWPSSPVAGVLYLMEEG